MSNVIPIRPEVKKPVQIIRIRVVTPSFVEISFDQPVVLSRRKEPSLIWQFSLRQLTEVILKTFEVRTPIE